MNIETNSNGYLVISDRDSQGHLFTEQYLYYSKREAIASFQFRLDQRNNRIDIEIMEELNNE